MRPREKVNALNKAIAAVGSAAEMARMIGVVPMTISQWKRRRKVPAERCLAVEAATDGAVTRYELREDVFGPAPAYTDQAGAA